MDGAIKKIIKYGLTKLNMYSEDSADLVFKTGMAESGYRHLRQMSGPALGFFQCEPATMDDVWKNYVSYRPPLKVQLWDLGYKEDERTSFLGNIAVQAAFCRLQYRRDKQPIPDKADLEAQAAYWKRVYNTVKGRGTVEHFIKANNG
jgi:hypothetical protein